MSIIVVSDVHIGIESSNSEDFLKFIDWIAVLEKDGYKNIKLDGRKIHFVPPEKIILLGDILELDRSLVDRKNMVLQAFLPFGKLASLRCEKIFVLGNHDEDILACLGHLKSKNYLETTGMKSILNISSNFIITNRYYPRDLEKRNLQIGKHKYFFLHGQQFDRLFTSGPIPLLINLLGRWRGRIKDSNIDKPKYRDISTIIAKKYYDFDKDFTEIDVNLIFGHTHVPEIHLQTYEDGKEEYKILFVNTGSWVREKVFDYNTFVYIDETGPYLFKWNADESINLLAASPWI